MNALKVNFFRSMPELKFLYSIQILTGLGIVRWLGLTFPSTFRKKGSVISSLPVSLLKNLMQFWFPHLYVDLLLPHAETFRSSKVSQ